MYYIENASNKTWVLGINGDDGKFVKNNVKRQQEYVFIFLFQIKDGN